MQDHTFLPVSQTAAPCNFLLVKTATSLPPHTHKVTGDWTSGRSLDYIFGHQLFYHNRGVPEYQIKYGSQAPNLVRLNLSWKRVSFKNSFLIPAISSEQKNRHCSLSYILAIITLLIHNSTGFHNSLLSSSALT